MVCSQVVEAEALRPKDRNGKADPYVKILVGGKRRADSRADFKPETLEPIFGQMFQMLVDLPMQKDLEVSIFDHDLVGTDELIGELLRLLTEFGPRKNEQAESNL